MTKMNTPKLLLVLSLFILFTTKGYAQIYGPELIPQGTFGTIASEGRNEDNGTGSNNIYPLVPGIGIQIPFYYQPADRVFYNGNLVYIGINPGVTIGKPLVNRTTYNFGMTEEWETTVYTLPRTNLQNSYHPVPHAPNNGYYLITTSTKGMYNLPSLNSISWYDIVDRYETNPLNPTNYFLVINADNDQNKIFYKEKVAVVPGQLYRISTDLARLNIPGVSPGVNFVISNNESQLTSATPVYTTPTMPADNGNWENYYFDYVAPCSIGDSLFIGFRNTAPGGNGNDVALDNLSMKAIIPQIGVQINSCEDASFVMLDEAINQSFASGFEFQWQKQLPNGTFQDISGSTNETHTILEDGVYRLAIYTTATAGCRMYSNEILVAKDNSGCWQVNRPIAVDDIHETIFYTTVTGNVLGNDTASDHTTPPLEILRVTSFTLNGTVYPAGASAVVMSTDGNTRYGVFTIDSLGNYIADIIPEFRGTLPAINYTIQEKNGGRDNANIYISFIEYEAILDASCTSCPVNFTIVSDRVRPFENYYLYRLDTLVATGVVKEDTINFTFSVDHSGLEFYTFKLGPLSVIDIPIYIAPSEAIWAPNKLVNNPDWNESANWITHSGPGAPLWCTDVVIPEVADTLFYPTISYSAGARDITFENGASVGGIHKLMYRRAFVDLAPQRDNWVMLSAPLKYIYSADYHADPTWGATAGVDPKIYMRYFDIKYVADTTTSIPNPDGTKGISVGNFSKSFSNLKEAMTLSKGFVLKVGPGANDAFSGTYNFPRFTATGEEVLYKYHYSSTGNWINSLTPGVSASQLPFHFTDIGESGRGTQEYTSDSLWFEDPTHERGKDNRYRFIYENGSSIMHQFSITVANTGTTNIVGNPYMSHIDFDKFYETNSSNIMPYYRIWNGSSFYSYMVGGGIDNGTWSGLPTAIGTIEQGGRYIAPMQAFFVEMRSGQNQIEFNSDSISVAKPGVENRLRSRMVRASSSISDLLTLHLKMNDYENKALLAVLPLATDQYKPEEDVYKLFSNSSSTPEIYTVSDGIAIEINALEANDEEKIVPIGIRTSQVGEFEISVEGMSDFSAYPQIYLMDVINDQTYDLSKKTSFTFEKETSDNLESRFYLVMRNTGGTVGVDEENNRNYIDVIVKDQLITVNSVLNNLEKIELYDVSGRLLYRKDELNVPSYTFNSVASSGIFILKVKSGQEEKSFKIKI